MIVCLFASIEVRICNLVEVDRSYSWFDKSGTLAVSTGTVSRYFCVVCFLSGCRRFAACFIDGVGHGYGSVTSL